MGLIIILFLLAILASLGTAFYTLIRDSGDSKRTVRALTFRISLSVVLFLLLMAAIFFGLIEPRDPRQLA